MNPISATHSISSISAGQGLPSIEAKSKGANGASGFGDMLASFVEQTNELQVASDESIENLVTGKTDNIQQVVLSVANAEMSFQLFMELRNKLVESYNELMRMQF